MFVLVLAAEADETRQAITLLIVCLVGIAVMLAALTVWYWLFTSPKRRVGHLLDDLGHFEGAMDPGLAQQSHSADAASDVQRVPAGVAAAAAPAIEATSDIHLGGAQEDTDSTDRSSRVAKIAAAAGPSILSESSDLMSTMLAGSPAVGPRGTAVGPPLKSTSKAPASGGSGQGTSKRAPITVPRPKAKPTKPPVRRADVPRIGSPGPTRIEIADRAKQADELAEARRRRARKKRDEAGLSDDDWAAVMKSAFSHLDR